MSAPATLAQAELPVVPKSWDELGRLEALNEALPHLRRPFTAAAVKWKV
jgi:hypothetical protein